eukprot:8016892-Alexandrium_andersonii.AAC.1
MWREALHFGFVLSPPCPPCSLRPWPGRGMHRECHCGRFSEYALFLRRSTPTGVDVSRHRT